MPHNEEQNRIEKENKTIDTEFETKEGNNNKNNISENEFAENKKTIKQEAFEQSSKETRNTKDDEVKSLKDSTIKTTQTSNTNLFDQLFADYPKNLPTEPFDFNPPNPRRVYHSMILSTSHLAKRIYLEMLRAINAYGQLLKIAPEQDKKTIENLQTQMEILSVAMLNIYGKLGQRQPVPFMNANRPPLSKNYKIALQEMYDRVYHIHSLVLRLLDRTGEEFRPTLIIILTNLKSQLKTIKQLQI